MNGIAAVRWRRRMGCVSCTGSLPSSFGEDPPRGLARNLHGEVRPAIPWVHLAHARQPQARKGSLEIWDGAGVMKRGNGLGVGGAEEPCLAHPVRLELRVEPRQCGK